MNHSLEGIIAAHLDAWGAPSGPDRDNLVAEVYSPDVFIGEPGAALHGHSGMIKAISGLQAQVPGMTISRSGPIQSVQDLVTYTWTLSVGGQPAIASGRDVLIVREGKITSVYVLIDTP
jgi:hypothetical protein